MQSHGQATRLRGQATRRRIDRSFTIGCRKRHKVSLVQLTERLDMTLNKGEGLGAGTIQRLNEVPRIKLCHAATALAILCLHLILLSGCSATHTCQCGDLIGDVACKTLERGMRENALPTYLYPWTELETDLRARNGTFQLIGYGSLLNTASARRNLSETEVAASRPVATMGVQRVFEYVMPEASLRAQSPTDDPTQRAALNVRSTGSPCDVMNGRLFTLTVGDLVALRPREFGYDLIPVPYVDWESQATSSQYAYVLSCSRTDFEGRRLLEAGLRPHPTYLTVCEDGARSISPKFLSVFRSTTRTSDGRTLAETAR